MRQRAIVPLLTARVADMARPPCASAPSWPFSPQERPTWRNTWLYRDQLRLAAELDSSGNVTDRYVNALGRNVPEMILSGASHKRLITDHLGSVRLVIDTSTGAVLDRIDYDAFGVVTSAGTPSVPFGFAGGLYDAATGLVRFGARDYDPVTGRWTAKDPIGFGGGDANLYGYTLGDPVNRIDPTGNWYIAPWWATPAGAVAGIAVGAWGLAVVELVDLVDLLEEDFEIINGDDSDECGSNYRFRDPGKLYDECRGLHWEAAVKCCNRKTKTRGTMDIEDPEFRSCMRVAGHG
jgi:RHS repeat-associated protein